MKLTSIERTATTCWSPIQYENGQTLCPLIATGSISGAFDASFSSKTDLEIFALDFSQVSEADRYIPLGKVSSSTRYFIVIYYLH